MCGKAEQVYDHKQPCEHRYDKAIAACGRSLRIVKACGRENKLCNDCTTVVG